MQVVVLKPNLELDGLGELHVLLPGLRRDLGDCLLEGLGLRLTFSLVWIQPSRFSSSFDILFEYIVSCSYCAESESRKIEHKRSNAFRGNLTSNFMKSRIAL